MPEQEPHDPSNVSFGLDIGASPNRVPGCYPQAKVRGLS